jgi:predicted nucleic acid-binding protein
VRRLLEELAKALGHRVASPRRSRYLLGDLPKAQEAVWEMLARGAVRLLTLDLVDIPRIREHMIKYADRPMDLADAALVRVAEREGVRRIFTPDRNDFTVYCLHGRVGLAILP